MLQTFSAATGDRDPIDIRMFYRYTGVSEAPKDRNKHAEYSCRYKQLLLHVVKTTHIRKCKVQVLELIHRLS